MKYLWNPTAGEQSILGQVRNNQSNGQNNVLFGGTHFAGFAAFPIWSGVLFRGRQTHAAGAYQFEPATWHEAAVETGVPDFSPASQDICALWALRKYGQFPLWATRFLNDGGVYGFAA